MLAKDIELDAVGRQFELYLTAGCVCTAAPLWCTVMLNIATATKRHVMTSDSKGLHSSTVPPY